MHLDPGFAGIRPVFGWGATLLLALPQAGCGRPGGGPHRPVRQPPAAQAVPRPAVPGPKVGEAAPEIEGPDLEGKPFQLSAYRGKVVFLQFWAPW